MKRSFLNFISVFLLVSFCHYASANDVIYEEIEWIQLMPEDDLHALMNPPEFLMDITDGSEQDSVQALSETENKDDQTKRFYQALTSTQVISAFNNRDIRIPGFIVPLQANEEQLITEFFIVPYFGACLHLPPPPPNQIIYAKSAAGVKLTELTQPFWFEGNIFIESFDNELGMSAYSMRADNVMIYE